MKKTIIIFFIASTFAVSAQTVSKRDKKFIKCTEAHGIFEVKASQLAQTKGTTPEIRELGKTMEQQRHNANIELKSIAEKKNITLPKDLNKKQQKCYNKLSRKEGKKFDKCYAMYMAKMHRKEICKFKKEARKTDDADLKNFANSAIPTLEQHKQLAKNACAAAKK